jgi:outer membrane lipoprotein SlyB
MWLILITVVVVGMGACSSLPNSPNVYQNGEAMQASATLVGVVVNIRPVETRSAGDTAAAYGALLGAVAFSRFGVGSGKLLATLAGAGVGAGAGGAVARSTTQAAANEVIVRLPTNSGDRLITVVEGADLNLKKGEWVYVIVTHAHSFLSGSTTRYRVVPSI